MKLLILDNYDSFTYNLYQMAGQILSERGELFALDVVRNDEITFAEVEKRRYDKIIISPGPGDSRDRKYFGISADVLTKLGQNTPILGVCLGMQGIANYFGGNVVRAGIPMHGKVSTIEHDGKGVFKDLPQRLLVMRYHSLIVEKKSVPFELSITALANDSGEIMGLRHRRYPIEGVQFHPESFATEGGKQILENFLKK